MKNLISLSNVLMSNRKKKHHGRSRHRNCNTMGRKKNKNQTILFSLFFVFLFSFFTNRYLLFLQWLLSVLTASHFPQADIKAARTTTLRSKANRVTTTTTITTTTPSSHCFATSQFIHSPRLPASLTCVY